MDTIRKLRSLYQVFAKPVSSWSCIIIGTQTAGLPRLPTL